MSARDDYPYPSHIPERHAEVVQFNAMLNEIDWLRRLNTRLAAVLQAILDAPGCECGGRYCMAYPITDAQLDEAHAALDEQVKT